MFSNISTSHHVSEFYPRLDSELSFAEYIRQCQTMIASRREDLQNNTISAETIIQANSPFECIPAAKKSKIGALLVHGLLDCPFTFRELAQTLEQQGIVTRSILLPGHGTRPSDLLTVTYQDWQNTVRYGVASLQKDVDSIFIIGYSTGAALAMAQAMEDSSIKGLILISPAVKLRSPIDLAVNWVQFTNLLGKDQPWVARSPENDYAKYRSVTLNSAKQVLDLAETTRKQCKTQPFKQPIYMILTREDETISSPDAIELFSSLTNPVSKLLLYSSSKQTFSDKRIIVRESIYKELNITHLSHSSLLFSGANPHYGEKGDYSAPDENDDAPYIAGAYNRIEVNAYEMMAKYNLVKHPRRVVTYNPDFSDLAKSIAGFISDC